jgi:hypothetical protein
MRALRPFFMPLFTNHDVEGVFWELRPYGVLGSPHSPGPTPSPVHSGYMLYLLHNGVGTSYLTSSGHSA